MVVIIYRVSCNGVKDILRTEISVLYHYDWVVCPCRVTCHSMAFSLEYCPKSGQVYSLALRPVQKSTINNKDVCTTSLPKGPAPASLRMNCIHCIMYCSEFEEYYT